MPHAEPDVRGRTAVFQLDRIESAGPHTTVPSLVLAVEPAESGLRGGVPGNYYGTVSWSSPNTPIPPEIYSRAVFDRLFDTSGLLRDRSVLDAALEQSTERRWKLASSDRQKLHVFATSVRELEQRIERAASDNRLEGWRPSLQQPDMNRPPETLPQDVSDPMRIMVDLLLLSWRMDKTRVTTLMVGTCHLYWPATLAVASQVERFWILTAGPKKSKEPVICTCPSRGCWASTSRGSETVSAR